ncbi:hypothetical protein ES703_32266 [subsurface metagenome]
MITKRLAMYILGGVITVGFFGLLILLIFKSVPEVNSEMLYISIGALIGAFTTVVGYFYGSSQGSSDKSELLSGKHQ